MAEKVRIRLQSYDHRNLDRAVKKIVDTLISSGAKVAGPIPLPTKIKRYSVLRSPHVDKKSQDAFEIRIHRRILDIFEPSPRTVDALMKIDLPAGIDVAMKS